MLNFVARVAAMSAAIIVASIALEKIREHQANKPQ